MHAERDIVLPMLSISICPPVRQMPVLCHVITLFRLSGRGISLVFEPHHRYKKNPKEPLSVESGKFLQILPFSSKTVYEIVRDILSMEQ